MFSFLIDAGTTNVRISLLNDQRQAVDTVKNEVTSGAASPTA